MLRLLAVSAITCSLALSSLAQSLGPGWVAGGAFDAYARKGEIAPASKPRILYSIDAPSQLQSELGTLSNSPERVASLVMRGDGIMHESYRQGATQSSMMIGYSMTKSLTALAVGKALCSGDIQSLDDRANTYAQKLQKTLFGEASIRDLLRMASGARGGANSGQSYVGMHNDLRTLKVSVNELHKAYGERRYPSGTHFHYNNLDTQALVDVVEGAVHKPFHVYFQEQIAEPAGIEQSMAIAQDREGVALGNAGGFAVLRDWARLGLFTLESLEGRHGQCFANFLREATVKQIDIPESSAFAGYGYQFWVGKSAQEQPWFFMLGYGGQRVGIDPKTRLIMVVFSSQPQAHSLKFFRAARFALKE